MRSLVPVLALVAFGGCSQPALDGGAVETAVRAFAQTVARDITSNGPTAWRTHFADSPSFFMAAEGRLVFEDSAAVTRAILELVRSMRQIELRWGPDLRVDVLTPTLAIVASPYYELGVEQPGARVEENGFFTGLAELRGGSWRFRNAHWSIVAPVR